MIVRSFLTQFFAAQRPFILLLALIGAARSEGAVSAAEIRSLAEGFLDEHGKQLLNEYGPSTRVESRLTSLDNRLMMADCATENMVIERRSQRRFGRINLLVSCEGPKSWSLYVPAEVEVWRPVVTLSTPVSRGQQLHSADLELKEANIALLNSPYYSHIGEAENLVARRQLRAGQILTSAQLQPPVLVRRGDEVIVTANSAGLTVKIPGIALADGQRGQQISVRNRQSKRIVEALVTGPGQVKVAM